jgi:hypothetical protein
MFSPDLMEQVGKGQQADRLQEAKMGRSYEAARTSERGVQSNLWRSIGDFFGHLSAKDQRKSSSTTSAVHS